MSVPTSPVIPNLGPSLGALEVGVFVAWFLSGMNAVQAFIYYQSEFHKDSRYIKLLIAFVVTVEMVHSGLISAYVYDTTINNFGNYDALDSTPWTVAVSIPVGGLAQAMVQLFFTYRAYIITRKRPWIPIISGTGIAIHFACSVAGAVESVRISLTAFTMQYRYLVILGLVAGASADTVNTSTLLFALYRARGGVTQSRKMIERLMLWSTETGILVAYAQPISSTSCDCGLTPTNTNRAVSFLGLILLFALPHTPAWLVVIMVFAKLYSNTMLATFNGRVALRSSGIQTHVSVLTVTGDRSEALASRNATGSAVHVKMTRQKLVVRDGGLEEMIEDIECEDPVKHGHSLSDPFTPDTTGPAMKATRAGGGDAIIIV
ncbi:unnamed protein product [Peniophora sp. CBMAI 1063]|nr:unnamed protein product [Peniophora sp. CBMAI 1063]